MSEIDALVANSKAHIEKWRNLHLNHRILYVMGHLLIR